MVPLRYDQKCKLILLLSVFLTFTASFYGQGKTSVSQIESGISDTISGNSTFIGNQTHEAEEEPSWVDPLFFNEGQLCQHVRKIFQDSRGGLWFGTNVYGIMHYNGNSLTYFDNIEGLATGRITGIVEDKEGNVWFGAYGGLSKYDGESFTTFTEKDGLLNNEIWSVAIDSKGVFWIGSYEGLSCFDGNTFTTIPITKASVKDTTTIYAYDRITAILEDRNGIFWFGTDGFGITLYNGNSLAQGAAGFTHITMEDGLPGHCISDLMEDKNGNIWIATMFGGISMYDGKTFTNFTEEGLLKGVEVSGLFEDTNGDIWFSVENAGVYRYDGSSFTNYYTDDGINTNGILAIYRDGEERFWFGGWGGLYRYDPAAVQTGEKPFFHITKEGPWD